MVSIFWFARRSLCQPINKLRIKGHNYSEEDKSRRMTECILAFIQHNPVWSVLGAITVVQIVPIKINPWSFIAKTTKKWLVGDILAMVVALKKEVEEERVSSKRWAILDFANSCRQGRKHTKEEWDHCLDQLRWYEAYCLQNTIANGVIEECAKYLRTEYQKLLNNNDFLPY